MKMQKANRAKKKLKLSVSSSCQGCRDKDESKQLASLQWLLTLFPRVDLEAAPIPSDCLAAEKFCSAVVTQQLSWHSYALKVNSEIQAKEFESTLRNIQCQGESANEKPQLAVYVYKKFIQFHAARNQCREAVSRVNKKPANKFGSRFNCTSATIVDG